MPMQMNNVAYRHNSIVLEGFKILGQWARATEPDEFSEYRMQSVFEVGQYETSDSTVLVVRMADEIAATMTIFCCRYGEVGMTARELIRHIVYECDTNFDLIFKDGAVLPLQS